MVRWSPVCEAMGVRSVVHENPMRSRKHAEKTTETPGTLHRRRPGHLPWQADLRGYADHGGQVLKQVAKGMPWNAITAEWRGTVTRDAIAEAVELAQRAFEDHAGEYVQESLTA